MRSARRLVLSFFVQLLSDPRHLQTCCDITCLLLGSQLHNHNKHAAAVSKSLHKPTLLRLLPTHTHATDTSQPWPVWSANLKRKRRSWWAAEGLVQRRPVEGCRVEKILCSTNNNKKNIEKKKVRKREEKNNNYWVNEEVKSKAASFLAPTHLKSILLKDVCFFLFFFLVEEEIMTSKTVDDSQKTWWYGTSSLIHKHI